MLSSAAAPLRVTRLNHPRRQTIRCSPCASTQSEAPLQASATHANRNPSAYGYGSAPGRVGVEVEDAAVAVFVFVALSRLPGPVDNDVADQTTR